MSTENMQALELAANHSLVSAVASAELDQQIMTAKSYPREIKESLARCTAMVTLTQEVAESCMYSLPRDEKMIVGAAVRFAEILANAWQNCRMGGRVIDVGATHLTAQGVFHDLEGNVAVTKEVRRRITKRNGDRYNEDMIITAGNAAISIALRNAVLAGIPQALWEDSFSKAKAAAVGKATSMTQTRTDALAYMAKLGAPVELVLSTLGVREVALLTMDDLAVLRGLAARIKNGEVLESVMVRSDQPETKPSSKSSEVDSKLSCKVAAEVGDAVSGLKFNPDKLYTKKADSEQPRPVSSDDWPRLIGGVWFDQRRLRFNPEIHGMSGETPAVTADGNFRKRRGCDIRLHERLEAEALEALNADKSAPQDDNEPLAGNATQHAEKPAQAADNLPAETPLGYPDIRSAISRAASVEACEEARDLLRSFEGPGDQLEELDALLDDRHTRIAALSTNNGQESNNNG